MDALLGWALISFIVFAVAALIAVSDKKVRRRWRLELEVLGPRIVPANHTWTGLGTTANVSEAANWNGGAIASGDSFTFDGSLGAASNKAATWDAAAPTWTNSITVSGAYTGSVVVSTGRLAATNLSQTAAAGQLGVAAGDELDAYNYNLQASTLNGLGKVFAYYLTAGGGATVSMTTVIAGGTLQVNGDVTLDNAATLLNSNSATWTAGNITVKNNSSITNVGSWLTTCDQSLVGTPGSAFFNAGSFTKNTTVGQTKLLIAFSNAPVNGYTTTPTVTANSGTIEFTSDANQAGQFFAYAPGILLFDSGTQTFTASTSFYGTGNVKLNNLGIFSANAGMTVSIAGPAFELGGSAALGGPLPPALGQGIYTISGVFTWDGGSMGNATVSAWGPLNITGAPLALSMAAAHLATYGQTTWDATCDITMQSSTIDNIGTFQIKNAQTIRDQSGVGNPSSVFGNDDIGQGQRGTVTKLAGAASTVTVVFNNAGTLALNGMSMIFTAALTQSGTNSVTDLGGGTLATASLFNLTAGTLIAPGTITGSIQMGGLLQFSGVAGVLTVTGDFTETAGSSIQLRVGGNLATQYDHISVGGTAQLNGLLHLTLTNGFTPAAADRFQVLGAGTARAGTWTVDPGWTPFYNPNDVTLSNP